MNDLVIIGASGHGKVVADIADKLGYENIVFLDDNKDIKKCGNFNVVGCCEDAEKYRSADFFVAIGNVKIRREIQCKLMEDKMHIVSLIHPAAIIAKNVEIGMGTVVMAGVVINSDAKIGNGCIVNTCASVDHDCYIGEFSHIAVGAHIAGTVKIGSNTWIGAGATVSNNIEIVSDCTIGAGAVVVKDIVDSGTYIGVPAVKIQRH